MREFIESENDSLDQTRQHFIESLHFPIAALLTIWVFYIFQWLSGSDWGEWGIYPRKIWGITGVVTAPLVHGSWGHLISNSFPLFVLTGITVYFYKKVAIRAFWMIYFLTGLSVWMLARPVYHIGASGVVYGLLAFVFWNGIFRRSVRSIILALMVMVFYSGMFAGILPDQPGVSWESHLLGSIAGIFASFWYKGELEEDEESEHGQQHYDDDMQKIHFLPRDIFEKTKIERALEEEEQRRAWELQEEIRQRMEEEARRRNADDNNDRYLPPPFWTSTWT